MYRVHQNVSFRSREHPSRPRVHIASRPSGVFEMHPRCIRCDPANPRRPCSVRNVSDASVSPVQVQKLSLTSTSQKGIQNRSMAFRLCPEGIQDASSSPTARSRHPPESEMHHSASKASSWRRK
ncbi:uncharacterized protein LOC117642016 [Thrips palmi]|uniref:Uncharacterized protein LOC117642016 n=1 Tax=Thrips palmi TaxID=161013 RepID=A0A6P8YGK4_THRPL|nr:uncharacterized protein LOC117642016 [Thrips palmi]